MKLSLIQPHQGDVHYMFFCPGCKEGHAVRVQIPAGSTGAVWTWNGSTDKPTFQPSILVYAQAGGEHYRAQPRCHSYVTDGNIQFLADCEHDLKGQTVPLPDF